MLKISTCRNIYQAMTERAISWTAQLKALLVFPGLWVSV